MVNKCCVPKCKSNYKTSIAKEGLIKCFRFPKEDNLRRSWLLAIPRENLTITKHTVICIKHFNESDIIKEYFLPGRNGTPDVKIPRTNFKLKKDAVPCIFPVLSNYLFSNRASVSKQSPSKKRKRVEDIVRLLHDQCPDEDRIVSYNDFCADVQIHNHAFKVPLNLYKRIDFVLMHEHAVCCADTCPEINFFIKVDKHLKVTVWVHGVKMLQKELSFLNLREERLTRWSELEKLVTRLRALRSQE